MAHGTLLTDGLTGAQCPKPMLRPKHSSTASVSEGPAVGAEEESGGAYTQQLVGLTLVSKEWCHC
eukprot:13027063-Alexandrium_andersonii.AAC.1